MYPTIVSEVFKNNLNMVINTFYLLVKEDWVCDDDWRPNFAQSLFFVGSIVGSLLFGFLVCAIVTSLIFI